MQDLYNTEEVYWKPKKSLGHYVSEFLSWIGILSIIAIIGGLWIAIQK